MKKLILIPLLLIVSCKDQDWGSKVHDFAFNESYGIVNDLSKKDLQVKWYNYFFTISSYGFSEINRANYTLKNLKDLDIENLDKDAVGLMTTSYKLDQQIQAMYTVNEAINNAQQAYLKSTDACNDRELFNIYTSNRTYLFNSLQMAMPQFNFTYGGGVTFATGDGSKGSDSNNEKGVDAIPLIGNVFTFFEQKKAKENKIKFQEGQDYINNLRLDPNELFTSSNTACLENKKKFDETFQILKSNIDVEKENFSTLYTSFVKLRNALAPYVIKNIIANFSVEDRFIYSVEEDNRFTNRMMEMYQTARQLTAISAVTPEDIEKIESKIEIANDLISELTVTKNSVLGIKNNKLISSLDTLLKSKKNALMTLVKGRL
ncbi:MAG: hypothetical protein H7336_06215 [Bacteriovorax sp.]|nr:hypothetical protein [Bacteriovorax sp.]